VRGVSDKKLISYDGDADPGVRLPALVRAEIEILAGATTAGANHYLIWSGTAWPARPDDALPVIWVGGAAPDNAPAAQRAGDVWIPASGDGTPLGATLTALQLIAATANRIPYFSADGVAALLTLSTNTSLGMSDTTLATQKAVKAYIDALATNGTLVNPTIKNYTETVFDLGNSGTARTIDLANGTVQKTVLTGNCVFTLPSPAASAGKSCVLQVNTGTGGFTGTFTGAKWPAGTAPTITTTAARMDLITLACPDGVNWYGNFAQNYTP
jgi:hypothetical protein